MRQKVGTRQRGHAQQMRRDGTDAERRLWNHLRDGRLDGLKFRRQVPVGRYIADFACFDARVIVEVDGDQHAESPYDVARDADLAARGFRVLRFWNHDVLRSTDDVVQTIYATVRGDR